MSEDESKTAAQRAAVYIRKRDRDALLLHAELNGHREVHRHRFAVQSCRLVFPLAESVHGRLVEQRISRNDLHGCYAAGGVDQSVDFYVTRNVLALGQRGIGWGNR